MSLLQRCTRFNFKTPQTPNPKFPRACLFQKDASILVTPATSNARQLRQCASPKEVLNAASAVCGCLAANNARSAPRTRPHCVLASGAPTLTHGACLPFSHARSPTMRAQPYVLASRAPTVPNRVRSTIRARQPCSNAHQRCVQPAVLQCSPTVRSRRQCSNAHHRCAFASSTPTVPNRVRSAVLALQPCALATRAHSTVRARHQYSNARQ
jgi:hypothetical protein